MMVGSALAGNLPAYYPESFQSTGTLDRVDMAAGEIVIGDKMYRISTTTPVHTLNSNASSIGALTAGTLVGLNAVGDATGARVLMDLWELPDSYSAGQ
jgi:hypothetical protein